jgi:LacI family transcriptional regulator
MGLSDFGGPRSAILPRPDEGRAHLAYPHKSQKIAETIARWFEEERFRAGDRFPSDQELAREFGVHHVTVRTAVKRFVDAGLLERRVGAGTVVRDRKRPPEPAATVPETPGVALAVPDATHSFFSEMLRAVEGVLLGTGRPLLFGHTWERAQREEQVVDTWLAQGIRRMILTPPVLEARLYLSLLERGVRLVFVDRKVDGVDVPSIVSRDDEGMSAIVKHLVGLGHRRLVHLSGPTTIWTGLLRKETFERQALASGLAAEDLEVRAGGFYMEDGYRATMALLKAGGPPEAIVAANDPSAVGAIRALQESGLRVPQDVSVTGYGDTDLGRNFGITSVRQFPDRMGSEAIRLILGNSPVGARDSIELMPELQLHTSTAPPRPRTR